MKELTKAEEQVMIILWQLEKAFVKDIIEKLEDFEIDTLTFPRGPFLHRHSPSHSAPEMTRSTP